MISRVIIIRSGAAAAVLALGGFSYSHFYSGPRSELTAQIEAARASVASLEKQLEEQPAVSRRLKEVGRTILGRKEDQVADRFRNGLGKIAEECGLVAIQDNSTQPRAQPSPLVSNTKLPSNFAGLKKSLKKMPDFSVVSGSVEGVGTLENVLRALALIQAQSWVHRVDGFSITVASGRDRDHYKMKIDVATLFAPDLAQTQEGDAPQSVPAVGAEAIWRTIASRNPFKEPAPPPKAPLPAPEQGPIAAAPPQPPPNPYADWRLSAVVRGGRGIEAWLVNPVSKQTQVLTVGGKFIDAVFVEGSGERAVFEMGGQKFELLNGELFTSRRPVR